MEDIDHANPTLRVKTRPNDANKDGDIFGGWLMSQIDIAGAIAAARRAKGPVVTKAVNKLTFLKPLFIYDIASFYTKVIKVGKTSLIVQVNVYVERYQENGKIATEIEVSDAEIVYVAVSKPGKKRLIS